MARKRSRPPVTRDKRFKRSPADSAPPERWQHSGREWLASDAPGHYVARALESHALDRLHLAGFIAPGEKDAALRLQEDFLQARVAGRVTASYAGARTDVHDPEARFLRSPSEEAAYRRWRRALADLPVRAQDIVIHVACLGNLPAPAQLGWLRLALRRLIRHYGL